jgi:hypothetical protein
MPKRPRGALPELAPRGAVVRSRTARLEHIEGRFAGLDDDRIFGLAALRVVYFPATSGEYYAYDAEAAVDEPAPAVDIFSVAFGGHGQPPTTPEELAFVAANAPLVNARRNAVLDTLTRLEREGAAPLEKQCAVFRSLVRAYPRAFMEEVTPESVVAALVLVHKESGAPTVLQGLRAAAKRFFDDAMFTLVCIVLCAHSASHKLSISRLWSCFAENAFSNLQAQVAVALQTTMRMPKLLGFVNAFLRSSWLHAMLSHDAFECAFVLLTTVARQVLGDALLDAASFVGDSVLGAARSLSDSVGLAGLAGHHAAAATATDGAGVERRAKDATTAILNMSSETLTSTLTAGIDGASIGVLSSCVAKMLAHAPTWIKEPLGVALAVAQLWYIVTRPLAGFATGSSGTKYALETRIDATIETLRASGDRTRSLVDKIPRSIVQYVLAAAIAHQKGGSADALLDALFLTRTGFLHGLLECMLRGG